MPVNSKHPDYRDMEAKWKRCRDAACGQDAVHAAGPAYLPKLKDQEQEDYDAYRKRAGFYNATWRTIAGLEGMIFRKPAQLTAPDAVKEMLEEDATLSGVPLQLFAQNVVEEALKCGRLGILVDYPQADIVGMTMADAQKLNLRPFMAIYMAEQCINWKTARVNNVTTLSMVVLEENVDVYADEFDSKRKKQYRVLDLIDGKYRVRLYELGADGKEIQIGGDLYPLMKGAALDYIPFTFVGVDDDTPDVDDPPLIDLVDMNLAHYRVSADYEHGCHFTGLPTPWIAGHTMEKEGERLYIGSSHAWIFKSPDAKAEFLEFKGEGLGALEKNLDRKEKQMAVLGARMLEQQKRATESADSQSIHRKGEESMLAMASSSISLAMEKALGWFAEWAGADGDVEYDLNREFYPVPMTPEMLSALVLAWQQGGISQQTLFDNLQAGDIIDGGTTLEEEQARIGDTPPSVQNQLAADPTLVPGAQPPAKKKSMTITSPKGEQYNVKED